ncbi:MAG TPA: alpha/beta fold hydrolase, partial [Burkholderiales bacterium]
MHRIAALAALMVSSLAQAAPVKTDYQIDGADPGVRLFVRQKMEAGTTRFTDDNIVLFIHGATAPSVCDFDLGFKDYSWADWMIGKGYVTYLFDKRNYGYSSREKAMDEPAASNKPVSRSYLVIRDIGAVVDHIRQKHKVNKVTLIGWSWGAMTAGYYTSLHSERVRKLVMYAPAYAFPLHTNLGPGSGLQNKRKPYEFNYGLGAYRLASEAANTGRWDGEIP